MKKEDLTLWINKLNKNKNYFAENSEMLIQPTFQQKMRQDKLTTIDEIKREHYEITLKHQENEQAKISERQAAEESKAAAERKEFEEWKRTKGQDKDK